MIDKLMNAYHMALYRLRWGSWCVHPAGSQSSQLVGMGRGRVFWCLDCGCTWFVSYTDGDL